MRLSWWGYCAKRLSVDARSGRESGWEHRFDVAFVVLPYVLLAATAVASLSQPGQTARLRLDTLVLVVVIALWVLSLHTLRPETRRRGGAGAMVYLAGLLVLSVLGMLHDPLFFIATITAFAHSGMLRSTPMVFVSVGVTALVINTFPYRIPDPTNAQLLAWAAVVVVQTALIGTTCLLGRLLAEQNDQRRSTVHELEATLAENAGLHAQLVTQAREAGVQDERQRMASEIHDTLTQGLAGVITQLEAAGRVETSPAARHRHIDAALALARESLGEARRSVHALHPEPLEAAQLPDVLETMVLRWSDSAGVAATFRTIGEPIRLVADVEAALFRTAQEALANIRKHARATRVDVTLSYTEDVVLLDLRDDGVGFEPALVQSQRAGARGDGHGYGLAAMRQRMQRVAGSLEIESEPGAGTVIGAGVPAIPVDTPPGGDSSAEPPVPPPSRPADGRSAREMVS